MAIKATLIKRLWVCKDSLEVIEGELDGWRLELMKMGSVESLKARIQDLEQEIELKNQYKKER